MNLSTKWKDLQSQRTNLWLPLGNYVAHGILIPQPGSELTALALQAQCL